MLRKKEEFRRAVKNYENGKYDRAIEEFENLIEEGPDDMDARFNLALCYMRKIGIEKQEDEWFIPEDKTVDDVYAIRAISELNKILEKDPNDEEAKRMIEGIKKVMDME